MTIRERALFEAGAELKTALSDGRVRPFDRANWEARFATDPIEALQALRALPPTQCLGRQLGLIRANANGWIHLTLTVLPRRYPGRNLQPSTRG